MEVGRLGFLLALVANLMVIVVLFLVKDRPDHLRLPDTSRRLQSSNARGGCPQSKKLRAGGRAVPIRNYDAACGNGRPPTSSISWIVCGDDTTRDLCKKVGCNWHADNSPCFQFQGTEVELQGLVEAGGVEFIEPDVTVRAVGDVSAKAVDWNLPSIGAPTRPTTGLGVNMYVMDTGARLSHTEFGGRAFAALDMLSGVKVVCSITDSSCVQDLNGHGTHTATTAVGTNVGVAPGARLRAVRVLDAAGSGYLSWVLTGLDWIAASGMRPAVASMSLGASGVYTSFDTTITAAVNAGVTVVVAAGNEASDACSFTPSFVPNAITVGAYDSLDYETWWSNYGSCVDIWAPGEYIRAGWYTGDSSFSILDGTSMACPHVAGAAALLLEANPTLTPANVMTQLRANSKTGLKALMPTDVDVKLYVGGASATTVAATTVAATTVAATTTLAPTTTAKATKTTTTKTTTKTITTTVATCTCSPR